MTLYTLCSPSSFGKKELAVQPALVNLKCPVHPEDRTALATLLVSFVRQPRWPPSLGAETQTNEL